MIISVKGKAGREFRIVVPTGLLLNRLTAHFIPGALEKRGIALTSDQMMKLIQTIRDCRRKNGKWKLLEAETADGDYVEILL